ncbi:hypothetical protein MesoLj113a_06750 [Mesorhizobium sp. 113-1-2]|nr:Putative uncharacterized protein [Mesorhizobium loti]BCG69517.1 hypothetical protein MesoLj113a_06750 [Mesorhizobium sp. 113-1-2]
MAGLAKLAGNGEADAVGGSGTGDQGTFDAGKGHGRIYSKAVPAARKRTVSAVSAEPYNPSGGWRRTA